MSRRSEGAFDITFAAMKGLWKFDEDLDPKVPPPPRSSAGASSSTGATSSSTAPRARSSCAAPRCASASAASPRATPSTAARPCCARAGFADFMVQAGGDLFVAGSKGAASWMVGVRNPRGGPRDIIARMPIKDHAFSTAGDYERSFVLAGRRYHHIIDPKTGYPATASREVTIYAPTAFLADALDDAVFILGPEEGPRARRRLPRLRRRSSSTPTTRCGRPRCSRASSSARRRPRTAFEGRAMSETRTTERVGRRTSRSWAAASWAAPSRCGSRRAAWPSPSSSAASRAPRPRAPRPASWVRRWRPTRPGRCSTSACAAARSTRRSPPSCATRPASTSATSSRACSPSRSTARARPSSRRAAPGRWRAACASSRCRPRRCARSSPTSAPRCAAALRFTDDAQVNARDLARAFSQAAAARGRALPAGPLRAPRRRARRRRPGRRARRRGARRGRRRRRRGELVRPRRGRGRARDGRASRARPARVDRDAPAAVPSRPVRPRPRLPRAPPRRHRARRQHRRDGRLPQGGHRGRPRARSSASRARSCPRSPTRPSRAAGRTSVPTPRTTCPCWGRRPCAASCSRPATSATASSSRP